MEDLKEICSDVEMNKTILEKIYKNNFFSEYISTVSDEKYSYDALFRPNNISEVKKIVDHANKKNIPIIPMGGGYSLSGQLFPVKGGFLVDLLKMNKIIEVNISDRYAIVECGVTTKNLNEILMKEGFYFPPAFNQIENATIGGLIGNNASNSYRHYPSDHVLGLEVMLSNGDIVKTGSKTLKNVSGYNTSSLFFGSEGSLGIILKAIIKIDPLPNNRKFMNFKILDMKKLFEDVTELSSNNNILLIEIIKDQVINGENEFLFIETTEESVEIFKNSFENLKLIQVNDWLKASDSLNYQYKEKFRKINEKESLIIGIKSNFKKIFSYVFRFKKLIKQYNFKFDYKVMILNNLAYLLLNLYSDDENSVKILKNVHDDVMNLMKSNKDSLIPDFGLGIWNLTFISDEKHDELALYEKIKTSFDPKNLLNQKNPHSKEVQKILELLK